MHRTIFERDLFFVCRALQGFYATHHSLEELFTGRNGVLGGLHELSALLQTRHVASPLTQSPCKRSNLMLRWLVRNDGIVDLGVWQRISPAELIIPLDVHVGASRVSCGRTFPEPSAENGTDHHGSPQGILSARPVQVRLCLVWLRRGAEPYEVGLDFSY
ncbi:MAG: DUF2400 domain-containing protein [Bacteroides graminisolvens]|nr:DUF2400 domain-containing protein [Bacteroides graminisolvens]